MKLQIKRTFRTKNQTLGNGIVIDHNGTNIFSFITLELPYIDNEPKISSIPVGIYEVVKRWSVKYGYHFWLQNVKNRSMILIHSGNYNNQTNGCILVGIYAKDTNNDGSIDTVLSKQCMQILNEILPNKFTLTIS